MKKKLTLLTLLVILILSIGVIPVSAQEVPLIHGILFYSPSCGHCEKVITEDLPPLFDEYGDQLFIIFIDVSTEGGSNLFISTVNELGYPTEEAGVPFMVVGDNVMVGSSQIPAELPGIIENGLAAGGINWPNTPTLISVLTDNGYIDPETGGSVTPTPMAQTADATPATEESASTDTDPTEETAPTEAEAAVEENNQPALTEAPTEAAEENTETGPTEAAAEDTAETENITPVETAAETETQDNQSSVLETDLPDETQLNFSQFGERFMQDPLANSIALIVLLWLISVVIWIAIQFMQATTPKVWPDYILPILLVIGLSIAIYLATVEVSGGEAVCGPVGDCNAVQASKYAKVFGVPVAVWGILGYLAIGASFAISKFSKGMVQFYAKIGMFLFALGGLLFFIYLTFLEPFVIGATCAWCISSAVIFSLINRYTTSVLLNAWADVELDIDEDEEDVEN